MRKMNRTSDENANVDDTPSPTSSEPPSITECRLSTPIPDTSGPPSTTAVTTVPSPADPDRTPEQRSRTPEAPAVDESLQPRKSCIIEHFKQIRIEILTVLSALLRTASGSQQTSEEKLAGTKRLVARLVGHMQQLFDFVQLLGDDLNNDEDSLIHEQIESLSALLEAVDHYRGIVNDIQPGSVLTAVDINKRLVSIVHITKDVPMVLRGFIPIVEKIAEQSRFEVDGAQDERQRSETGVVTVANGQDAIRRSDNGDNVDNVEQVESAVRPIIEENNNDADQPPSLPPKQRMSQAARGDDDDDSYYQPVVVRRNRHQDGDDHQQRVQQYPDRVRPISESELETPDVRASGISQTTVEQLEELRRQADSQPIKV